MMDRFDMFVQTTLESEGGYVSGEKAKKIGDTGGATKYGISLRFLKGCGIGVGDINKDGLIDEQDIILLDKEKVISIYKKYFWNPLYNQIPDVNIAFRLFDFGVNAGVGTAVKLLQRLLGVKVDGVFGRQTLEAIRVSKVTSKDYDKLIEEYYRSLNKPNLLKGWLNRIFKTLSFSVLLLVFVGCSPQKEIVRDVQVVRDTVYAIPDFYGEGDLVGDVEGFYGYDVQGQDTILKVRVDTIKMKVYVRGKNDTLRITDTLYFQVPVPEPVEVEIEVIPLWVWLALGICSLIIVGRLIK